MPQPLYPPTRPQSIGQVLDSGFRIFETSLLRCLVYGALSMVVGQLPNIYFIATGRALEPFGGGDPMWLALYVVGAILTLFLCCALILRQHGAATGRPLSFSVEMSEAIRRLPAYLLLVVLGLVFFLVAGALPALVYAYSRNTGSYVAVGIAAAIVLVPLVYALTPFTLVSPALLLDRKAPVDAISYGLRLVRGNWWRTTTILTVTIVVVIVFYFVATVIVMMALPLVTRVDLASVTAATTVVYVVLGGVSLPFITATVLATYGELKVRKEGLDLEQRVASLVQS